MKHKVRDLNAPSRWNMRIWDDDKKEWLCQSDDDALTYYGFDITGGEVTEFQALPKWHPDRHLIWEQSTGLKDKNGTEIYEGDILRLTLDVPDEYSTLYQVVWDSYYAKADTKNLDSKKIEMGGLINGFTTKAHCEVIGNIHENPELLEGE